MSILFFDEQHSRFYHDQHQRAKKLGIPRDAYFDALVYLCGLCEETRRSFHTMFDWKCRGIVPGSLNEGWQTGTTRKVTRLAFNLWNGFCGDDDTSEEVSPFCVPDEIFCCHFQPYFFEAIRLRFPEYSGLSTQPDPMRLTPAQKNHTADPSTPGQA